MVPQMNFLSILWTAINFVLILFLIAVPILAIIWAVKVNRHLVKIEEQLERVINKDHDNKPEID